MYDEPRVTGTGSKLGPCNWEQALGTRLFDEKYIIIGFRVPNLRRKELSETSFVGKWRFLDAIEILLYRRRSWSLRS